MTQNAQVSNLRRASIVAGLAVAFVAGGVTNAALTGAQPDVHLQPGQQVTVYADVPPPVPASPTASVGASTAPPSATPKPTASPTPTPSSVVPNGTIVPATKGALASAVSACVSPCTLWLRGGSHVVGSMIVTTKAISILAYPGETPVITDDGGRPDLLYFEGGPVLVRGITFATSAASPTFDDTGGSALLELLGQAHDVTIEDTVFIGSPKMASRQQLLYIAGRSATLKNLTFRRVTLQGNGTKGYGIHFYGDNGSITTPAVSNVLIDSIRGEGFNSQYAVVFWARESTTRLINSDFYGGNGVRYHNGLDVDISGNRGHAMRTGLLVEDPKGLTTSANVWTLP